MYPFPHFSMSDSDSGSSMMVALVAIVVIIAIGFFALQMFSQKSTDDAGQINVNLPSVGSSAGNQ